MIKVDKKIFVSKIPIGITRTSVVYYFSNFGPVSYCNLVKNEQGENKGFAIIGFSPEVDTEKILNRKHRLNGAKISLKPFSKRLWIAKQRKVFFSSPSDDFSINVLRSFFESYGKIKTLNDGRYYEEGYVIFEQSESAGEVLNQGGVELAGNFINFYRESLNPSAFNSLRKLDQEIQGTVPRIRYAHRHQGGYQYNQPAYVGGREVGGSIKGGGQFQSHPLIKNTRPDNQALADHHDYNIGATTYPANKRVAGERKSGYRSKRPRARNQARLGYLEGEFMAPDKLRLYLTAIYRSNLNIKQIPKNKLRKLELFYYNKTKLNSVEYTGMAVSYYTVVERMKEYLVQNHTTSNLRMNFVKKNHGWYTLR